MADTRRAHSCPLCPATFTSNGRLQRHERTRRSKTSLITSRILIRDPLDTDERQSVCPFCHNAFTRSYVPCYGGILRSHAYGLHHRDSARRHTKACAMRKGRPVPGPLKRGRRFRACDSCAVTKSACDGGRPCCGCVRRDHSCTYTRVEYGLPAQIDIVISARTSVERGNDKNNGCNGSQLAQSRTIRMSFLLRYTDPHNNTLQDYFDPFRPDRQSLELPQKSQDLNMPTDLTSPDSGSGSIVDTWFRVDLDNITSFDLAEDASLDSLLTSDAVLMDLGRLFHQERPPYQFQRDNSQMDWRLAEIISALSPNSAEENSCRHATTISKSAEVIFKVGNVDTFVQVYFDNWHQHCPVLRRSAFNPETTFTPLLAAIMLIGAIYYSENSAKAARACLNVAENYIFGHHAFRHLFCPASYRDPRLSIEPLQAAFLISVPQHWDHHQDSRHRVRLHRYADLISVARNLGLPKLRHEPRPLVNTSDWEQFTRIEEGIRLVDGIDFYDCRPRL